MAIAGSNVPVIQVTLTLPSARVDGTALALTEIASATILRDSGAGPAPLGSVISGPFSSSTVLASDTSPATGSDIYSFYVTDTAGTQGVTSTPVTVTVAGATPLAAPAAGTLTAVAQGPVAVPVVAASVPFTSTPVNTASSGYASAGSASIVQPIQPSSTPSSLL